MTVMEDKIKLTSYSHGGGCGCKIAPQVLEEILKINTPTKDFKNLLVGNTSKDDAAVYQLNEKEALVSTTDFFTPIVDDPYIYGQVAAANAISDVYAMGGSPILALAILGWPIDKLPIEVANKVLEGARNICEKANIPLAGGHSIDTPEPIFGLSVNGLVPIKHLKHNNKAQEGDVLLLTKPIGVGIMSSAAKKDVIEEEDLKTLYSQLVQLNDIGYLLGKLDSVHAMTDVTGFGLAGHLIEMCEGSGFSAVLDFNSIPKIAGVEKYLKKNISPDATSRNWKGYGEKIKINSQSLVLEAFQLLPDPQTNGGLLIAVDPSKLSEVQDLLRANNYEKYVNVIGKIVAKGEKVIVVE